MSVRNTDSQGIGYCTGAIKIRLILTEQLLRAGLYLSIKPRRQAPHSQPLLT